MSKYRMSMLEQETIILFNRAEEMADAQVYEPSLKRRLEKFCELYTDDFFKSRDNGNGEETYVFPKNLLTVSAPRQKKILTEEQKEILRERLKKNKSK